jgi:hypothetical protein
MAQCQIFAHLRLWEKYCAYLLHQRLGQVIIKLFQLKSYFFLFNFFGSIVQNVMNFTPKKQRYILAVDPVLCQQDQIVKAISQCLGTGMVKKIPGEDIYLNRELNVWKYESNLLK